MELWRELNIGDPIRLVEISPEFFQEGYVIAPETSRLYKRLLARPHSLRICGIDQFGRPWVRCRFRRKSGRWVHHHIAIDHDGIVRVKSRIRP